MPRTQTLNAQTHTERKGDKDLRGLTRSLRPQGRRERCIDIHKATRGFIRDFLKNSLFSHFSKEWVTLSIYSGRRKP